MKKAIKYNPILTADEQELEKAVENNEYVSNEDIVKIRDEVADAAITYLRDQKSKNITLRVGVADLATFRAKTKEKGIPYQTALNMFIRQYNSGKVTLEA